MFEFLKPNTNGRCQRDATVDLSRVGGVYMNSRRLPTDLNAQHSRRRPIYNTAANGSRLPTGVFTVHTDDTMKLSPTSCEFVDTPPTRRDSTVSSRLRRRCVLGITNLQNMSCPRVILVGLGWVQEGCVQWQGCPVVGKVPHKNWKRIDATGYYLR